MEKEKSLLLFTTPIWFWSRPSIFGRSSHVTANNLNREEENTREKRRMNWSNWGPPPAVALGRDFWGSSLAYHIITHLEIKTCPSAYYNSVACWACKHIFQSASLLDISKSRCNINSKVNREELGNVCNVLEALLNYNFDVYTWNSVLFLKMITK